MNTVTDTTQIETAPIRPKCAVSGTLHGGRAMCGYVIVGLKYCGLPASKGACEHQLKPEKSLNE
jgi:hypothetical protein